MLLVHGITKYICIIVAMELKLLQHLLGVPDVFNAIDLDHTLCGLLADILE